MQFVLKVDDGVKEPPTLRDAILAAKKLAHYDALVAFLATQKMTEPGRKRLAANAVVEAIGHLWVQPPGKWAQQVRSFVAVEVGVNSAITLEDSPCLDFPVFNVEPERPPSVPPEPES